MKNLVGLAIAASLGIFLAAMLFSQARAAECKGMPEAMADWTTIENTPEYKGADIRGVSLKGDDMQKYLAVIETIFIKLPFVREFDELLISYNINGNGSAVAASMKDGCVQQWVGYDRNDHFQAMEEAGISVPELDN